MESYTSYQSAESGGSAAIPPVNERFNQLTHTIGSDIQKISQNVSTMSKMFNQLQGPTDSQELRNQLRNIQNYTQKLIEDTSALLIELMNMPLQPNQTAAKLNRTRLSDEYMTTLNKYQSVQKTAAFKTKQEVSKTKNQNFNISNAFNQNRNDNEDTLIDMEVSARRQEQLTLQTERELQELEQNERDMRNIETNIVTVNEIFKNLGQIITDQGMIVDSIETSIERASDNVQAGGVQLREAATYQNKSRMKKIYLTIILLVVIAIILYLLFR